MPAIYKTYEAKELVGIKCDICDLEETSGNYDFVIHHTFGYGTEYDGDQVEVALCDPCLIKLIKEHVPGATWRPEVPY